MDIIIILFDGLVTSFLLTFLISKITTKPFKIKKLIETKNNKILKVTITNNDEKMEQIKNNKLFRVVNLYKELYDISYEEMDKQDTFRFFLSRTKYWVTLLAISNVLIVGVLGLILKLGSEDIINAINYFQLFGFTYRQIINNIIYGNAILVIFNCIVSIGITIKQSMDVYDDKLGSMMMDCMQNYLLTKLDEEETNGILKFAGVVMVNCIDEDIGNKLMDSMAKVKYSSPEVGEKILKTIVNELEKDEKKLRMLKPNGQEALAKLKKII